MKILCAGALAAGVFLSASAGVAVARSTQRTVGHAPVHVSASAALAGRGPYAARPWIEGYQPTREDELFRAIYPVLPAHNVLKVYVSEAGAYDAAGIRFSARVPHSLQDIDAGEMRHEAALLIKTAFERFPDLQTLDVWATVPVAKSELTTVDSTVFSVSADRPTYVAIRNRGLADDEFLTAFGKVWLAPQVPR
ncbi:MAG: hypothetical protein JO194_00740 [Candidatus Eremiobacteraeota bacterium]|nr:hypothetical protein [Candidatus Eremiobacteraeota bacterium]